MPEVVPFPALVTAADLRCVRVVAVGREPALDRLPVERLVAVPVVLGRGDDGDDRQAGRLEHEDGALEGRPRLVAVLVVVRQRQPAPVRLADGDVPAGTNSGDERVDRVRKAPVDETRAEAERRVVRLRLEGRLRAVLELEGHPVLEPRRSDALHRNGVEVGRDLDPVHGATELAGEEERRPAAPGRDVEDARLRPQAEALPEQQDLLLGGRVLQLVHRLRDDVIARDHGAII